ncbi:MAG: hypothetical protein E7432_04275 [Ruminococcaceae bacterium]|nr:hypothetical protein [Oscillospiraceae bacterium]
MKKFLIMFVLMFAIFVLVFSVRADIGRASELERELRQLMNEYDEAVVKGDKTGANRAAAMYNDYIFSYSAGNLPKGIKYRLNEVK